MLKISPILGLFLSILLDFYVVYDIIVVEIPIRMSRSPAREKKVSPLPF